MTVPNKTKAELFMELKELELERDRMFKGYKKVVSEFNIRYRSVLLQIEERKQQLHNNEVDTK